MTLPLPATIEDSKVQECLDVIAEQFPIQEGNLGKLSALKLSGELPKESVGAEQLKASAKELFLQLAAPAKRIHLFGQVSAAGAVALGEGFTSEETGVGKYTIKLKAELATTAVFVGSHAGAGFSFVSGTASTKKEVKVENFNALGALAKEAFNFTIDG